jgi:enediyne biosynthesis protein E4
VTQIFGSLSKEERRMAIGREGRGRVLVFSLIGVVGVGLWCGRERWVTRQYQKAMEAIKGEIDDGHHALAARDLRSLLAWTSDRARPLYLLGFCEKSLGHPDAAAEAWAQVSPSSRFAIAALVDRMELEVERGRLADAERLIRQGLAEPRIAAHELALEFAPVYAKEGRVEDAQELIEAAWTALDEAGQAATEPAILLVQLHTELPLETDPVEAIRSLLDRSGRLAPDDDRVWLGKANLAIRVGSHDEAARWLDLCLGRRPDDASVWRARLNWSMASNRVEEALEALRHLPADGESPARTQRRAAWLAARRGDSEAEERALESVIVEDPADFAAHDRLIELAIRDGQPARADELRGKKSEVQRLEARYLTLYRRNQPTREAEEMAHLAEQLGRRFEARGFLTLATAMDPDREDLRADLARIGRGISSSRLQGAEQLAGTRSR